MERSTSVRPGVGDDEAIAELASRQHGIAGRSQLLDLGVTRRALDHRLAVGRLRRVHTGVYAVGHEALTHRARILAAVIAVAPDAVASHLSAATLWGLCDPPAGRVAVTAARSRRPRPGVAIHRGLPPRPEIETVHRIRVTTVPRTLLDLSGEIDARRLRRLVKQAEFDRLADARSFVSILERYPRRRGRRALARIVRGYVLDAGPTRSELEDRFLAFCAERGLPRPETNQVLEVGGRRFEVDCVWRTARLIVELDGRRAHGADVAFHDDRARDRALIAAGWSPMRVTWAHLRHDADTLESEIRGALAVPANHGS